MGNTSTAVKNRWNAKTYDRICITIPKGYGDKLKEYCEERGEAVNAVVMNALNDRMKEDGCQISSFSKSIED